jgi:hypothetical protein
MSDTNPAALIQEVDNDTQKARLDKNAEIAYKDAIDNILATKRQQLIVVTYGLLGYTALYAISRNSTASMCFLIGVGTLLAAVSLYGLLILQRFIAKMRDRLTSIYRVYFSPTERSVLGLNPEGRPFIKWYDLVIVHLLLIVSGFLIFILLLTVFGRS